MKQQYIFEDKNKLSTLSTSCTSGNWYIFESLPGGLSAPSEGNEKERAEYDVKVANWKTLERSKISADVKEFDSYLAKVENPTRFGSSPTLPPRTSSAVPYFCFRTRMKGVNDIPEDDLISFDEYFRWKLFTAGYKQCRSSDFKQPAGQKEIEEKLVSVHCDFKRLDHVYKTDEAEFDLFLKRRANAFDGEMARIEKETPRYFHNGDEAKITEKEDVAIKSWKSRRTTCMIDYMISDYTTLASTCACRDLEKNAFKTVGLTENGFSWTNFQCRVPLANYLQRPEIGGSCMLDQIYTSVLDATNVKFKESREPPTPVVKTTSDGS
jgi:hypothetical protein